MAARVSSSSTAAATPYSTSSSASVLILQQKKRLRKAMTKVLQEIPPETRKQQSIAVTHQIQTFPQWKNAKCVGLYLSMPEELQTRDLLLDAFAQGKTVLLPKVTGGKREDMQLLQAMGMDDIEKNFIPSKWGIPEPPDMMPDGITFRADWKGFSGDNPTLHAATMSSSSSSGGESASSIMIPGAGAVVASLTTQIPPLDLLLTPGVAFDANCWRLGHGKGYYDAFIRRVREHHEHQQQQYHLHHQEKKLEEVDQTRVTCIALALEEQMVDSSSNTARITALLPSVDTTVFHGHHANEEEEKGDEERKRSSSSISIPHDDYDERLDGVITATRVYIRQS